MGDEKNVDDCVSAHDALIRRAVWVSVWEE